MGSLKGYYQRMQVVKISSRIRRKEMIVYKEVRKLESGEYVSAFIKNKDGNPEYAQQFTYARGQRTEPSRMGT